MKTIIFFAGLFLIAAVVFQSCENEEAITTNELPQMSREFLNTHFRGVEVSLIIRDKEAFSTDYTVHLANGFEVDFLKSGDWDDVDGHLKPIPESVLTLLPDGINTYLSGQFAEAKIVEVNKENYGYEIELSNGLDIRFSKDGAFRGIDD
ncbi:MAG: PepSY-like domain-containing protein [Tannerella sp.]|jgi:hypothetical protein|nr:PepSY-like domain-containing protein [Tannerella sp.]